MKTGTLRTVALAASALIGLSAHAAPTFSGSSNGIYFQNVENLYRTTESCNTNGGCLAAVNGDPAGYQRINPGIVNNIRLGDVFVGVLNVQNIDGPANAVWNSGSGGYFTGYFAQQVVDISFLSGSTSRLTLGTAVDPFNILQAGEMFRLYYGANAWVSGGAGVTAQDSINSITANTFWGSLGLGSEGYAYTLTNLDQLVSDSNTEAFLGLDFINKGTIFNLGDLYKVNDFNESIAGGVADGGGNLVCTEADLASAAISCTDIVGTSEIEPNNRFTSTLNPSPWMFASNDPFQLQEIPEPGTLALVGLALGSAGFAAARRRRNS